MTILLQLADFNSSGGLSSPPWTLTGGTLTQDGQRISCASSAVYCRAVLAVAPSLTTTVPITIRYEVDVTMPSPLPSGLVRLGLCGMGGALHLVYEKTAAGTSQIQFCVRNLSSGAETSYFTVFAPAAFTALSAGESMRIRADVQIYSGSTGLSVAAFKSLDAGVTWAGPLFVSTPSLASWNTATGQALSAMTSENRYGGIVYNVAGSHVGYLDNLRVLDAGSAAVSPQFTTVPALTAAPSLTPITVGTEDDGTLLSLTVQPSFAQEITDQWRVVDHPYEGGYVASVATQTGPRRKWRFHWDALSSSQRSTLITLRDAVGRTSSFAWIDPETGASIRIRFATDPVITQVAPAVWTAEAEVQESLSGA